MMIPMPAGLALYMNKALGEEFSTYYAVSRRWEPDQWREAVSDWERERYTAAV
jgi:glutamine synthetase